MLKKFRYFKLKNNKYSRFLSGVFLILFFSLVLFFAPKIVKAVSGLNGAAWWGDELKFIYFNCSDYEVGSRLDKYGNFQDFPEPRGFKFFISGCTIDHGVQIDNNGNFTGAAFNHSKGMINFGGSSTPVLISESQRDSFKNNCFNPSLCTAANFCAACYNSQDQRVYGYAQASSTGDLIRLDSNLGVGPPLENNLHLRSWNLASSTNPEYMGVNSGDFFGHASSTVAGVHRSLSFNCLSEYGIDNGGSCLVEGRNNYKVYIKNPEIGQMTAPNWPYESACSPGNAKRAILKWILRSGAHVGYEVRVTKIDNVNASGPDLICDSGYKAGSALQYAIPNSGDNLCTTTASLSYNTNYYWFVRLYYVDGAINQATQWYQFGANDGHEGELYDIDNGPSSTVNPPKTFTTYKHEFPVPYFTWDPPEIVVGATTTIFTALTPSNESKYYSTASPATPINCDENGLNCYYLWSVTGNTSDISDPGRATTTITFNETGGASVSLRITDSSEYFCTRTTHISDINYGLPVWREVKAE